MKGAMGMLLLALYVWIFSYILYHLNPMCDESDIASPMHYYFFESMKGREAVRKELEKDKETKMIIEWNKIQPYLYPTMIAIFCMLIYSLLY